MAPRNKENYSTSKKKKPVSEDEDDEDYRRRRDRNNQAVKRSRVKSKLRTQQTLERVNQLKNENELLEEKIKMLTKELGFLKDLFLAHAGSNPNSINIQELDLNALLAEESCSKSGDSSINCNLDILERCHHRDHQSRANRKNQVLRVQWSDNHL